VEAPGIEHAFGGGQGLGLIRLGGHQRNGVYGVPLAGETKQRRQRRSFTDEFRAGAVRLVLVEGKSIPQVARDLDLTESSVRTWVERARADQGKGKPGVLTTVEREELAELRKEVRTLRMERDILKKAAAFFAKENS
jgi:transposase